MYYYRKKTYNLETKLLSYLNSINQFPTNWGSLLYLHQMYFQKVKVKDAKLKQYDINKYRILFHKDKIFLNL